MNAKKEPRSIQIFIFCTTTIRSCPNIKFNIGYQFGMWKICNKPKLLYIHILIHTDEIIYKMFKIEFCFDTISEIDFYF